MTANQLETTGGYFGWILELIQQRHTSHEEFSALLQRVVTHLEAMPAAERLRWLELLSHLAARVYHDRSEPEHEALQEIVRESVETDEHRQEVFIMQKSAAEVQLERGMKLGYEKGTVGGLRRTLLRQLGKRFGKLPKEIERAIRATQDTDQLDAWLYQVIEVDDLDEMAFVPK